MLPDKDMKKPAQEKQTLRVVSYNVHFGKNTKEIARVFTNNENLSKADIILFQEIEFHQAEKICRAEAIAKHLGYYFAYEPARKLKGEATHGLATLSRWPIKSAKTIRLPKNKLFFITQQKIALITKISIKGKQVIVCNIHLDTRLNPKKRIFQLNACLKKLKPLGPNIIIAGDFNTIPFRSVGGLFPVLYSNQSKHLHEFMLKSGFKYFCKPLGYTMKRGPLKMRLDHIYSNRLPIISCGVEKEIRVSDHKPIWADVSLL
jgi:endonuclease/exonuclease/phosphatase family metal-dependent hydrolase